MTTPAPERDDPMFRALVALLRAHAATENADQIITSRKTQYPDIRATRVTTNSNTGLARYRNRLKRLGIPKASTYINVTPALQAAEADIEEALAQEKAAHEEAREAATAVLDRHHKAVAKAEERLAAAVETSRIELARLLEANPEFSRVNLAKETQTAREAVFRRLRDLVKNPPDLSDSTIGDPEEHWKATVKAIRAESKARRIQDEARQERKQALVDLHHASGDLISVAELTRAAGLTLTWTRDFLTESRGEAARPGRGEAAPAPRFTLDSVRDLATAS